MHQTITLHGGPWHGKTVALEEGRKVLNLATPRGTPQDMTEPGELFPTEIPLRHGTYSEIRFQPGHFEWDGWRD